MNENDIANDPPETYTITRRLTNKQSRFLENYKRTGNAVESAISAGYSAKSSAVEANRLLKHPLILQELDKWRKEKQRNITREDFVDLALNDYHKLDVVEPNKPRFLDIAGKTLGYIGASERGNSTTNNVQINIALTGNESQGELWELTRKLIGQ